MREGRELERDPAESTPCTMPLQIRQRAGRGGSHPQQQALSDAKVCEALLAGFAAAMECPQHTLWLRSWLPRLDSFSCLCDSCPRGQGHERRPSCCECSPTDCCGDSRGWADCRGTLDGCGPAGGEAEVRG